MANKKRDPTSTRAMDTQTNTDAQWELFSIGLGLQSGGYQHVDFSTKLKQARAWRKTRRVSSWPTNPPDVIRDAHNLANSYGVTTYHGYGKLGQPVFYESGGEMTKSREWSENTTQAQFNAWLGLRLEHEMRRAAMKRPNGPHKDARGIAIYVSDARGYSMETMKMLGFARVAKNFYDSNGLYTKPIHAFIMVNMPPAMRTLLKTVSGLAGGLAEYTHFIGTDKQEIFDTLTRYIEPHQIPMCYGGRCSLPGCKSNGYLTRCIEATPNAFYRDRMAMAKTRAIPGGEHTVFLNIDRTGSHRRYSIKRPGDHLASRYGWLARWSITIPGGYTSIYSLAYDNPESGQDGQIRLKSTIRISGHNEANPLTEELEFNANECRAIPDEITLTFARPSYMMANKVILTFRTSVISCSSDSSYVLDTENEPKGACGCFLGPTLCK